MLRCIAAAFCSFVLSSGALAQVIYQPITYQHDAGRYGGTYLYGGANPQTHLHARYDRPCNYYAGNLHRFDGGNSFGQPSPMYDRTPIYSDCAPFQNLNRLGWTAADAANEARANAPTYFRKIDLLASAVPQPDGSFVVPFYAPTVRVVEDDEDDDDNGATTGPSTHPSTKKGAVIIIPKRLLDKRVKDLEAKPLKVAAAK